MLVSEETGPLQAIVYMLIGRDIGGQGELEIPTFQIGGAWPPKKAIFIRGWDIVSIV